MTLPRAPLVRLALSLQAGVLLFLAVPTFDLWPLMWIAMVPQIHVALTAATPRRAFFYGWLTGGLAITVSFSWMGFLLEHFGHMPALEAIPIMMLLVAYQSLEFGFLSWGIRRVRRLRALPLTVVAPLVMAVIELCTPQIFPFYLGFSQVRAPVVIQIADLTGPIGVTALLLAFNGAIYDAVIALREGPRARVVRPLVVAAVLVLLDLAYGLGRMHQVDARRAAAPKVKTGLVQANVGILEKWDPHEFAQLLDTHQRLSADLAGAGAELVVWPESSYPYALSRNWEHDFPVEDRRRVRRGFETPLLFGAVTVGPRPPLTPADRYPYNTAIMMDAEGRATAKYDKVFLMLFGEYIPFYDSIPWFTKIFPEASNFNRGRDPAWFPLHLPMGTLEGSPNSPAKDSAGQSPAPSTRVRGRDFRLGPLICYEDILPGFTRRVAGLAPNALVNITNDAWFGRTAEPYQHLALAVFRTVENRLEMVRAVNTGVSAHIDAAGRVLAETASVDPADEPPPPPTTLLVDLALLDGGGLYRTVGDLFGFGCLAALVALIWRASAAKRRDPGRRPPS